MSETYRDGVQMERCLFCGGAVRGPDTKPVVFVLADDLEGVLRLLNGWDYENHPALLERLHSALGLSVRQVLDRIAAEAIPAHIKTDRGGLVAED